MSTPIEPEPRTNAAAHERTAQVDAPEPVVDRPLYSDASTAQPAWHRGDVERVTTPESNGGAYVGETTRLDRAEPAVIPSPEAVLTRERDQFGGIKIGSAFFGWLTATGLAVLLLAILAAIGVAFGVTNSSNVNKAVAESQNATGTAKTVGLVGAIVLLVILFLAYYCGGYVAGRMARFNGAKQGLAVWLWAIVTSAIIAAVVAIGGSKYNVLAQLNLPRIPVKEGDVTTVGLIAIAAAVLAALLGALLGGALGTRFHRRVDAAGYSVLREE